MTDSCESCDKRVACNSTPTYANILSGKCPRGFVDFVTMLICGSSKKPN